jgi:DNA repair photolyase
LKAARVAGARRAGLTILRLPGPVKQVFEERVRAALPLRAERILRRVRETRGGNLYDPRWTVRQTGEGNYAEAIAALFEATAKRLGFEAAHSSAIDETVPRDTFERPPRRGQMRLF